STVLQNYSDGFKRPSGGQLQRHVRWASYTLHRSSSRSDFYILYKAILLPHIIICVRPRYGADQLVYFNKLKSKLLFYLASRLLIHKIVVPQAWGIERQRKQIPNLRMSVVNGHMRSFQCSP